MLSAIRRGATHAVNVSGRRLATGKTPSASLEREEAVPEVPSPPAAPAAAKATKRKAVEAAIGTVRKTLDSDAVDGEREAVPAKRPRGRPRKVADLSDQTVTIARARRAASPASRASPSPASPVSPVVEEVDIEAAAAGVEFFESSADWRAWLQTNHASKSEVWVGYWRKATGRGMTWPEAVDEALCFGWIDSVVKRIDETRRKQRFTPRRPKSNWSDINLAKMASLRAAGKVHPNGEAAFARRTTGK